MEWFKKNSGEVIANKPVNHYDSLNGLSSYSRSNSGFYYIKMGGFDSLKEVETIKNNLEEGNIMILDTEQLLQNNQTSILELKRAIEQLRGYCKELGGSIGRIGDKFLIITPNPYIRIAY